jgi:MFS superfamily sulfate permease-like transporter
MMARLWSFLSILLTVVAAFCLWRNNLSAAFVTAALGACSWFLSYRAQLRDKNAAAEEDSEEQQTTEGSDEN